MNACARQAQAGTGHQPALLGESACPGRVRRRTTSSLHFLNWVITLVVLASVAPAFSQDKVTNIMSSIVSYQYPENFAGEALTNVGISSPIVSYQYPENLPNEALTNGDISSPIVSYQYPENLGFEALTNGNISSPIVSYQYPENLVGEIFTNGGIMSPIASYQYCEWPGNAILNLQSSPVVSYFYNSSTAPVNLSLSGKVTDALGQPVAGATISASVFQVPSASAQTAPDGIYILPALPAACYLFAATKTGYTPDQRVVTLNPTTAAQNFQLTPLPLPLQTQTANSTPAYVSLDLQNPTLLVFDSANSAFDGAPSSLDTTKMTIVLTHGWIQASSSPDALPEWTTQMATAMKAAKVSSEANIVAWDWHKAARTTLLVPQEQCLPQGQALGAALYKALRPTYSHRLHFIGHSLGALVNAEAANYLAGFQNGSEGVADPGWLPANFHLTLLDEGELGIQVNSVTGEIEFIGGGVLFGFGNGLTSSALASLGDYASPIPLHPEKCAWIDNYISAFGLYHPDAADVYLSKAQEDYSPLAAVYSAFQMHGYAISWYLSTIANAGDSLMGFTNSFERATVMPGAPFPPVDAAFQAGSGFQQDELSSDWLKVVHLAPADFSYWNAPFLQLAEPSGAENRSLREDDLILGVVNVIGTASTGWLVNTELSVGSAFNYLVNQTAQGVQQSVDLLTQPQIQLKLATTPPPQTQEPRTPTPRPLDDPPSSNTPAAIWLPVMIPPNAADLTFDFTVTGTVSNDSIVFGINQSNLFSLQLMYLAPGQNYTSSLIDVSTWAGTSNQLFFAILGGTSTNANVQINNIQFLSFGPPSISIGQSNAVTTLSWPSSANGFTLESATDLSTADWATVTNVPSLFGGFFTVSNTWPDQTRFFRLLSH